ncbi:MAG TPA: hypothetical protein VMY43_04525 [Methanothrix sp.]|nr:hypothetical protein [Methanothrix sp.]
MCPRKLAERLMDEVVKVEYTRLCSRGPQVGQERFGQFRGLSSGTVACSLYFKTLKPLTGNSILRFNCK